MPFRLKALSVLLCTVLAAGAALSDRRVFVDAQGEVEVRQVFREERFTRGNVNLRPLQAADAADWIWIDDEGPAKGEMDAVRFANEFVCGGRGASVPRQPDLEFDISADQRFVLFLDGREIARGPHKGLVNHWYYQSYAVNGLGPGSHLLEAVVYRMGSGAPRAVLSAGKGGFVLKAYGDYDKNLTTGKGKWAARRIKGTRMTDFGDSETLGGSAQCVVEGAGFLDPAAAGRQCATKVVRRRVTASEYGFPRSDWALFPTERPDQTCIVRQPGRFKAGQPVYKAGTNVYYVAADAAFPLVEDMNVLLSEGRRVTIPAGTSARLVWDLGDYYCAYPVLETSGGKGAEVRWGWAEALYDRNHDRADRNAFDQKRCAHALRDTFRMDGRALASFTSPWWRCGRWCEFEVKTSGEPLTIRKLSFAEVRYPLEVKARFECDAPDISDVWRLCLRGLENCMHETYMDCPYFEQQMYPGDTRVMMLIASALSGDARLNRFGVGIFDYGRRDNGLVPMNCPCVVAQDSATYSMCWVTMLGDYALWHGGKEFIKARLPGMRHTLHLLLNCVGADGTLENLPGWSFQDWVEEWDTYGNAPDGRLGAGALNNLLCVYALDGAIRAETFAGEKSMAAYWREKKDSLARAIMSKFWCEERGLVADTAAKDRFSEHSQCLALLSGILPPGSEARVLKGLWENESLAPTTVYFAHYLFDTCLKYGRPDVFMKRLDLWRGYVKTGLKTPLEAPGVRARSDCHAWGSHPIYHLLTGVAGIKPAANGFAAVRIAPQPGNLKLLKATMPTPKGDIVLDLRFRDNDVSGMVTVPDSLSGTFVWQGAEHPLGSGINTIHFP